MQFTLDSYAPAKIIAYNQGSYFNEIYFVFIAIYKHDIWAVTEQSDRLCFEKQYGGQAEQGSDGTS